MATGAIGLWWARSPLPLAARIPRSRAYPLVWYLLHRYVLHGSFLYKMLWSAALWKRIHFDYHRDPTTCEHVMALRERHADTFRDPSLRFVSALLLRGISAIRRPTYFSDETRNSCRVLPSTERLNQQIDASFLFTHRRAGCGSAER